MRKRGKAFCVLPEYVVYLDKIFRWKDRAAETVEERKKYANSRNIYWAMVRPYGSSRHQELVRRLKLKEAR